MTHTHPHRPNNAVPVHRITEAHESHTVDHNSRVRKYTISMTIRVLCFIAAFFTHGPLQWILLVGAVVLPYIAVVIANRGADVTKRQPPAEFFTDRDPSQLPAGVWQQPNEEQAQPEPPEPSAAGETIEGTWADAADDSEQPDEDAAGKPENEQREGN